MAAPLDGPPKVPGAPTVEQAMEDIDQHLRAISSRLSIFEGTLHIDISRVGFTVSGDIKVAGKPRGGPHGPL